MPSIDLVALLRPTLSPGLYLQMVGRGARIAEGKLECLVLDFAGNVDRHGLIDDLRVSSPSSSHSPDDTCGDAPARVTMCKSCRTFNHISCQTCTSCGAPLKSENAEVRLDTTPDNAAISPEYGRRSRWTG